MAAGTVTLTFTDALSASLEKPGGASTLAPPEASAALVPEAAALPPEPASTATEGPDAADTLRPATAAPAPPLAAARPVPIEAAVPNIATPAAAPTALAAATMPVAPETVSPGSVPLAASPAISDAVPADATAVAAAAREPDARQTSVAPASALRPADAATADPVATPTSLDEAAAGSADPPPTAAVAPPPDVRASAPDAPPALPAEDAPAIVAAAAPPNLASLPAPGLSEARLSQPPVQTPSGPPAGGVALDPPRPIVLAEILPPAVAASVSSELPSLPPALAPAPVAGLVAALVQPDAVGGPASGTAAVEPAIPDLPAAAVRPLPAPVAPVADGVPPEIPAPRQGQPPAPQVAALETIPSVAAIRGFVDRYDGGACFAASVAQAGPNGAAIDAFSTAADKFTTFDNAFKAELGLDPDVVGQRIWSGQCPAVDFLREMRGGGAEPLLRIDQQRVRSGEPLSGRIAQGHGPVRLYLVDERGATTDLTDRIAPTNDGRFSLQLQPDQPGGPFPQMLVAVAGLPVPNASPGKIGAQALFAGLLVDRATARGIVQATGRMFLLSH